MKKSFLIKLNLFFILFIVFILFISATKDTDIFGKVTLVLGDVKIYTLDGSQPSSLKINTNILLGDTIETGKESKAEIIMTDNKTKIIIMEKTKVKLSSLINPEKQKQTIISILFGSVSSIVQKLSGSSTYVIQTPNGSASVRGTEFAVSVSDTVDTVVSVTDGVVVYQKDEGGQYYSVTQNQYCITEIDKSPEISSGEFETQTWLNDRNSQFEQNSAAKSDFIAANLINIIKTIGSLVYAVQDFVNNSLVYKLLTKRLTPFEIFQFASQKGSLLQRVYEFYFRLNLYDTIVLGFYRFFDFLSKTNPNFIETKDRCWQSHLNLSNWISKVVELYKVIWLFY
jgi:hypothetical protein